MVRVPQSHTRSRGKGCRRRPRIVLRAADRQVQMVSGRHLLCSTTRLPHQFQPIGELQETQYPGNAGFNLAFSEIQLVCDFAVTQASTHQTIDRKKDAQSFPEITHYAPAFSRSEE